MKNKRMSTELCPLYPPCGAVFLGLQILNSGGVAQA